MFLLNVYFIANSELLEDLMTIELATSKLT